MASELGWDPARKLQEIHRGKEFLQTMGVVSDDDTVRGSFSPYEIVKYRRIFNEFGPSFSLGLDLG